MVPEADRGIRRHGKGAGADGDMRFFHAHEIEKQGNREDRPAAADEPEDEADEDAGDAAERIMKRVDHMLIRSPPSCAASPSTHARGAFRASRSAAGVCP